MNNELIRCKEYIDKLCEHKNFSREDLDSRARFLYLLNKLNFLEDFPILLKEIEYQKKLAVENYKLELYELKK